MIDAVKHVSRRPVQPALENDLVAELGFDSLEVLELVAELEDRFGITVPEAEIPTVRTISQIVQHVARLVEERAARA